MEVALGEDGLALIQEYAAPDEEFTYRVWFLTSGEKDAVPKVQHAVQVRSPTFNSCALNSQIQMKPWKVPSEIAAAVENLAKAAESDAGSVEFLLHEGLPLFYDFNLVSSFPPPTVSSTEEEEEEEDDLYGELAASCLARSHQRNS